MFFFYIYFECEGTTTFHWLVFRSTPIALYNTTYFFCTTQHYLRLQLEDNFEFSQTSYIDFLIRELIMFLTEGGTFIIWYRPMFIVNQFNLKLLRCTMHIATSTYAEFCQSYTVECLETLRKTKSWDYGTCFRNQNMVTCITLLHKTKSAAFY